MQEKVEIATEEYISIRNKVNQLQSENYQLKTIIESITLVLRNGGIVKP